MNIPKLDIFLDKKYWVNRDDNYGTLCKVDLDSDGGIVDFNTNINPTSNTFVDNLFKYLTARDTKRLITISYFYYSVSMFLSTLNNTPLIIIYSLYYDYY